MLRFITSFLLASLCFSSRFTSSVPLLSQADSQLTVAPSQSSWYFTITYVLTRISDWWYGRNADCRAIVIWEPDETSAEEWFPEQYSSSDDVTTSSSGSLQIAFDTDNARQDWKPSEGLSSSDLKVPVLVGESGVDLQGIDLDDVYRRAGSAAADPVEVQPDETSNDLTILQ